MSVLPDHWIRHQALTQDMINPFVDCQKNAGVISFGLSSYGYDLRVSDSFKLFTNVHSAIVDPKNFSNTTTCVDYNGAVCTMPPHSFMLAQSIEYFKIPRDVLVLCLGKSTYARCGINVHITPVEPEWEGHLTLEFSNTTSLPVKIYAHEGAGQLVFLKSDSLCQLSYKDRKGKYMYQTGITPPLVQDNT